MACCSLCAVGLLLGALNKSCLILPWGVCCGAVPLGE